jgi:hypothetical protein
MNLKGITKGNKIALKDHKGNTRKIPTKTSNNDPNNIPSKKNGNLIKKNISCMSLIDFDVSKIFRLARDTEEYCFWILRRVLQTRWKINSCIFRGLALESICLYISS